MRMLCIISSCAPLVCAGDRLKPISCSRSVRPRKLPAATSPNGGGNSALAQIFPMGLKGVATMGRIGRRSRKFSPDSPTGYRLPLWVSVASRFAVCKSAFSRGAFSALYPVPCWFSESRPNSLAEGSQKTRWSPIPPRWWIGMVLVLSSLLF